jgi:hypothetical protein
LTFAVSCSPLNPPAAKKAQPVKMQAIVWAAASARLKTGRSSAARIATPHQYQKAWLDSSCADELDAGAVD